jgi:Tfp pilus assembly protein PilX
MAGTSRRRGTFLIVALICLAVATALIGTILSLVETERRQVLEHQLRLQAEWLAESALDRAVASLRADSAYTGEAWAVESSELGGADPGLVTIRVDSSPDRKHLRVVRAEAVYPVGSMQPIRRTRQTTIAISEEF